MQQRRRSFNGASRDRYIRPSTIHTYGWRRKSRCGHLLLLLFLFLLLFRFGRWNIPGNVRAKGPPCHDSIVERFDSSAQESERERRKERSNKEIARVITRSPFHPFPSATLSCIDHLFLPGMSVQEKRLFSLFACRSTSPVFLSIVCDGMKI